MDETIDTTAPAVDSSDSFGVALAKAAASTLVITGAWTVGVLGGLVVTSRFAEIGKRRNKKTDDTIIETTTVE